MNRFASIYNRFLNALGGLALGGILGMLVYYGIMVLVGLDSGLHNVRPGGIVGGVIGSTLGICYPKRWGVRYQTPSRRIVTALFLLASGTVCLGIATLGVLTGGVYDTGGRKVPLPRDLVSWGENPVLFLFALLIWVTFGVTSVGLSVWNLLEASGRNPTLASFPGSRILLSIRDKWNALPEVIQIIIAVYVILSPFIFFGILAFLGW